MYCGSCECPCEQTLVDMGRGPYEFWGRPGIDVNEQWLSDCCEVTVYDDRNLTIESDIPSDSGEDEADHKYNERYDR